MIKKKIMKISGFGDANTHLDCAINLKELHIVLSYLRIVYFVASQILTNESKRLVTTTDKDGSKQLREVCGGEEEP